MSSIRTLRARTAAHTKWAKTADRAEATAAARVAFRNSFFDQTDPALPEAVRRQQAESYRKAHYSRLGLASAMARRSRRDAQRSAQAEQRAAGVVHPDGGTA